MTLRVAMLYLTLCGLGSIVNAQTVYRCGPDGRSYSQTPCADGRAIEVADTRSDEQRRQSRAAIDADKRLADELERERLASERRPTPAAASLGGTPRAEADQPWRSAAKLPKPKGFKAQGASKARPKERSKEGSRTPPSAAGTSPRADPSSRRAPG
ncbi:hypothetical protein [Caldimonas sp. KR1-144]|uniref:hypothetical protein n=1 Tax=Caldimonas sp. KR1-144 TaxID=3400911 RepID=UPI003BFFF5A1